MILDFFLRPVIKRPVCIVNLFFARTELTRVRRNAFFVIRRCSLLQLLTNFLSGIGKVNSFSLAGFQLSSCELILVIVF